MATYKKRLPRRDITIDTAILIGSLEAMHYAVKSSKDKLYCVRALIAASIPVIPNFPKLSGYYLQHEKKLNYENALGLYKKNGNVFAIYHFLKEVARADAEDSLKNSTFSENATPQEHNSNIVDFFYQKFLNDGVPEKDILFYRLPEEIKKVLFQQDQQAALDAVLEFYRAEHPKIEFIIYDFLRQTPNAIGAAKVMLDAGIPKRVVGSKALISVIRKKMTVQELAVLYDFDSPHFREIMNYMLDNHKQFGYPTAVSLTEKMVYHGIDKNVILMK